MGRHVDELWADGNVPDCYEHRMAMEADGREIEEARTLAADIRRRVRNADRWKRSGFWSRCWLLLTLRKP